MGKNKQEEERRKDIERAKELYTMSLRGMNRDEIKAVHQELKRLMVKHDLKNEDII